MKIKTYLRIAKTSRGYRANASTEPDHSPLFISGYRSKKFLPTVHFALLLDIPDNAFDKATEVVAELNIPEEKLEINAEVKYPVAIGGEK